MEMADSKSVKGPVKATKTFSSIAGNWRMCDGQHHEELLFVPRHFSANSSVAGPSKSFLGLLARDPFYFFVSEDFQVAKSRFGHVITPHTLPLDGTDKIVGPALGFSPARIRCSQVDCRCLKMELKLDTEIMEIKFQLGEKSTASQFQLGERVHSYIVFDAQFVRVKAFPSNVGSQAHSSQVPSSCSPVLESSTENESSEDDSTEVESVDS
ncbi:unnamed protein product [Polarella glacialis]|uniref:Uncharacterized protein n=1 Tax=Polarella glacialis TaxID=89957 RepID=A0A813K414_POLGL|nr:unnamed protein product [Polarella glacialis]